MAAREMVLIGARAKVGATERGKMNVSASAWKMQSYDRATMSSSSKSLQLVEALPNFEG